MENASKALIIAASTLIGIMILSFMVYTFKHFSTIARRNEERYSEREIQAFNSKFESYETDSLDDEIRIVDDSNYRKILLNYTGSLDNDNYKKNLIAISQNLNNVTDVVTAINDAININYNNSNGYKYGLETLNSVEIIVDLVDNGGTLNKFEFSKIGSSDNHYRYLIIEPNKSVKSKKVYGATSTEINKENKTENIEMLETKVLKDIEINIYDLLKELRDTKSIVLDNKTYTVYKYYFTGEYKINEQTGLIDSVQFTLVEDKKFD